jgi:hypothetical protein
MTEVRNSYKITVRKPNVERSFKEPRYRRGENNKIDVELSIPSV